MPWITRRKLLQAAGATVALPALTRAAGPTVSPVMKTLSEYMSAASAMVVPAEVMEQAKLHILDTLAAIISGTQLPPGKFAVNFARMHMGEKVATVAGSNVLCGAADAALSNGILGHSDETDDYAPVGTHPGCAVLPAVLAVSEQLGGDGTRLLRGTILGYDVANRFAAALGGQNFNYDGHKSIHTVSGTFAAAAAAGCVAGLNPQQFRWTMDYASQQASGIAAWQRDTEHIEKAAVYAGFPARNGVTAALMVQAGATGVDDVFSGRDNYFEAYKPDADLSLLTSELGRRFEITRTTIKKWTVGGPAQAALDALELILKKHPIAPDQVKQLIVKLGPKMGSVVNNREMPDINVQHMLAVMLIDKTASFAAAHDKPRMQDPAVLKQRAKVQLVFEPTLEPNTESRQAIVEVTLTDGTVLREHVTAVRGTVANPMSREEVLAKARELLTPVLKAPQTAKLIERIMALESMPSVRDLRPLLQVG